MRVGLRHRGAVLDVVPHHDVVQTEVGRRSVRHVAHYDAIRYPAVLLHNDQVTVAFAAAHVDNLVDRVSAAVHALRVGHEELDLLEELHELARWVARGGDQDLGVGDTRVEVLRVYPVRRLLMRRVVEGDLSLERVGVVSQLGRHRFAALDRFTKLALPLRSHVILCVRRLLVQIFPSQTSVLAQHRVRAPARAERAGTRTGEAEALEWRNFD